MRSIFKRHTKPVTAQARKREATKLLDTISKLEKEISTHDEVMFFSDDPLPDKASDEMLYVVRMSIQALKNYLNSQYFPKKGSK